VRRRGRARPTRTRRDTGQAPARRASSHGGVQAPVRPRVLPVPLAQSFQATNDQQVARTLLAGGSHHRKNTQYRDASALRRWVLITFARLSAQRTAAVLAVGPLGALSHDRVARCVMYGQGFGGAGSRNVDHARSIRGRHRHCRHGAPGPVAPGSLSSFAGPRARSREAIERPPGAAANGSSRLSRCLGPTGRLYPGRRWLRDRHDQHRRAAAASRHLLRSATRPRQDRQRSRSGLDPRRCIWALSRPPVTLARQRGIANTRAANGGRFAQPTDDARNFCIAACCVRRWCRRSSQ
jgi:hypothetical protein